MMEHPLTSLGAETVAKGRLEATSCLKNGCLVIVGPCSIHDPDAAMEYAAKLKDLIPTLPHLTILMRVYFEKPRTTVGWKGLINDPFLDDSYQINSGLRIARKLLVDLAHLGVPVGCELLDTISPQFLADCVSWGAIGARTTESQLHRELASGVSFPVGFKNGTDGSISIAMDAVKSASHPHSFLGVTKQGLAAITRTRGNDSCHVILRGSKAGPNYEKKFVDEIKTLLASQGLSTKLMVDCSHGNSNKNHKNQLVACASLAQQISDGDQDIFGIMIESNLNEGNQKMPVSGPKDLEYGVSITDACVHWEDTVFMLKQLNDAVGLRDSKV